MFKDGVEGNQRKGRVKGCLVASIDIAFIDSCYFIPFHAFSSTIETLSSPGFHVVQILRKAIIAFTDALLPYNFL
jgi:hypothetical protein